MKKFLLILVITLVMSPSATIAMSQTRTQNSGSQANDNNKSTATPVSEKSVEKAIKNCERIESRVQNRYKNYETKKDKHMSVYNNMLDKLGIFVDLATNKDIVITELESSLSTFEEMINEFELSADTSYQQMQQTKTSICGSREADFRQSLIKSRNQLRETHRAASAIRDYYHSTIRPLLLETKDKLQLTEEESSDSDTEETAEITENN